MAILNNLLKKLLMNFQNSIVEIFRKHLYIDLPLSIFKKMDSKFTLKTI